MAMQRSSAYAKGTPLLQPAPNPIETQNVFGTTDYNYPFGQLAYEATEEQVVFHAGKGNWIPLGGSDSTILTINNIPPTTLGNFNIVAGSGLTITPGANQITIGLSGGSTAIDSFIVPLGTSPVVPDSSGNINLPAGNGFSFTGGLNSLTGNLLSPFTGDFAFTSTTSGDTETLTISNSSNTASSQAQVLISVAGAIAGDAFQTFTVAGVQSWSIGVDNSDLDNFKISASNALGNTDWLTIATSGNGVFSGGAFSVERELIGDVVQLEVVNDDDTNPNSAARLNILTEGTGGDAYCLIGRDTAGAFEIGVDNSSDMLLFNAAPNASVPNMSGNTVMSITPGGNITLGLGIGNVLALNNATSATASAGAGGALPVTVSGYLNITVNGTAFRVPLYLP